MICRDKENHHIVIFYSPLYPWRQWLNTNVSICEEQAEEYMERFETEELI